MSDAVRTYTAEEREAIRKARNEYARRRRQRVKDENRKHLDRFYYRKAVEYGLLDVKNG